MKSDDNNLPVVADGSGALLRTMATLVSAVPYLGGPISSILSGIWTNRQFDRLRELSEGLADDLRDYKSEATDKFVQTEEFEELLVRALDSARREVSQEKRRAWRRLLVAVIMSPHEEYSETLRYIRALDELQMAHIAIFKAMRQEPDPDPPVLSGSIGATLKRRLPAINQQRIDDLIQQLQDMRVLTQFGLNTMMTGHGAEDLRNRFTPFGSRLIRYILEAE